MTIIKLPGPLFIVLENVNMIQCFPENEHCCLTWTSGDAPLALHGADAIAFITALESLDYVDATDLLVTEQEAALWVGTKYDID
jgi:hypothetical protein